jgi:hypothetical protein
MLNFAAGNPITGYNLSRSLRFRSSASATLSRTFGTPTNNKIWTQSLWVKRGSLAATRQTLLASTPGGVYWILEFDASNKLNIYDSNAASPFILTTTQTFVDPSAWYHIVVAEDTTQATASNRTKVYVNGVQVTSFSQTNYPAQNSNPWWNAATYSQSIASALPGGGLYFDGYLAEVNFIDGQALTPSSFGSTNSVTGVWQPAPYTGTYGTNGFYLPFTDNSALTTSSNVGLGRDYSGNGNYWTTNNISITAGVTYDSMTDVPTLTSATAANFAVLNPLNAAATLNDGNMNARVTGTGGNYSVSSTIALSSGLIYFETTPYVFSLVNGQIGEFGICYATANLQSVGTRITNSGVGVGFGFGQGSSTWFSRNFGTLTNLTGLSNFTTTTIAMVAINLTTGNMWVGKDGTWYNSGNPATGANPTITGIPSAQYAIGITAYQDAGLAVFQSVNFGQRPFTYTPPTGFVALNTFNLPDSTIKKGSDNMNIALAAGASIKTTTEALFTGQFLEWIKDRANVNNHQLLNGVTGLSAVLQSNTTAAETTYSAPSGNSVGWAWKAGSSSSSNTNGTITSTVSVNASAGFSVVTYTGTGVAATVGHGLGVAPSLIIVKDRTTAARFWTVYHQVLGNTQYLQLDSVNAAATSATAWNNTSPTSSVFTIGTGNTVNSADSYVAYCWSEIAGFSKFGSYTGNSSADGPFVYTGFRPKFVLIKSSTYGGVDSNWNIIDTSRNPANVVTAYLNADQSAAESSYAGWDILSNGFKIRNTGGSLNNSGATYLYAAFAENPFKNSLAR